MNHQRGRLCAAEKRRSTCQQQSLRGLAAGGTGDWGGGGDRDRTGMGTEAGTGAGMGQGRGQGRGQGLEPRLCPLVAQRRGPVTKLSRHLARRVGRLSLPEVL